MDDPVCHVVAADHVPQPLSGSRTADSFFSFFMPSGSKSASLRMATHFLYALFCIFSCLSAGDIHFYRISSSYIHPLPVYRSLTTSSYFFHIFPAPAPLLPSFLPAQVRRSPRLSPLHTPNGPALLSPAMFRPSPRYTYSCPRPAILTAALVPLYLQLPSSRYTCSCPLPVPSQVGMQFPKTSLLSALFAFCIVSPTVCLCPWIQIVYNV